MKKELEKEKKKNYNKSRKVILPELPKVEGKNKKMYLVTFLSIFTVIYSGLGDLVLIKLNISNYIIKIFLILLGVLICGIVLKNYLKRDIKYFVKNRKKYLDFEVSVFFVYWLISIIMNCFLKIVVREESKNQIIVKNYSIIIKVVYGVILGPILEELVFRGLLKKVFKANNTFLICSSLIFGLIHVIPFITNPIQLLHIVPYFLAGLQLGYVYLKTDNIITSITLHMFNNLFII